MEFFRKGSDPPPFGSYGTRGAHLIFGHQKGEKTKLPKNTQNGHILNKLL